MRSFSVVALSCRRQATNKRATNNGWLLTFIIAGAGGTLGCTDMPEAPNFAAMEYAEIVAEEDARGRVGLERIFIHLDSDNPGLRAMAVRALGRLEEPQRVARIEPYLDDQSPRVRAAAAFAMAHSVSVGDSAAVAEVAIALAQRLTGATDNSDNEERHPTVLGALAANLGRLNVRTPEQRRIIAAALVARGEKIQDSPLWLDGQLGLARGLAAFARSGGPGGGSLGEQTVALAQSLTTAIAPDGKEVEEAARIRRLAVATLARWNALDIEISIQLMTDPDWGVRREVMIGVSQLGRVAEVVIATGLADLDPRVRLDALRAYDRAIRPTAGCAPFFHAFADSDPDVVIAAINLTAQPCPDTSAQQSELRAWAEHDTASQEAWHRPAHALNALANVTDPGELHVDISRWKAHPNPFARAWVARTATASHDLEALHEFAADADPNVREVALRGLSVMSATDLTADPDNDPARNQKIYTSQLEADDPQLVMTAARILSESGAAHTAQAELLSALARFTTRQRETQRDVRIALLEAIAASGSVSPDELLPYLKDFDPAVAERAASLLTAVTGESHSPDPYPLPPLPTPSAERLTQLATSAVILSVAGLGEITIALRPDLAATNADRFARLAHEGYFDGLTFHRAVPNFVIQGGSPKANEYAGDGPYSRDEISAQPHWRGTVGLSTRGRDTGDAQIFINLVDNLRLDFNYTIFGEVVDGMEVVDALLEGAVIEKARLVRRR